MAVFVLGNLVSKCMSITMRWRMRRIRGGILARVPRSLIDMVRIPTHESICRLKLSWILCRRGEGAATCIRTA